MSERAAYSRVYWSIVDDPKFVGVFDDDRLLAGWLRLLLIADQSHPASGHIPANVRRSTVSALVSAGLVDLVGEHRFRIHGLDAERAMRSESGRNAAAVRWHPTRTADPMLDETRRDKTRQDEKKLNEIPTGRERVGARLVEPSEGAA